MKGLRLFASTNSARCFSLASYHDPESLTWSWLLSWTFPAPDERRHLFRFVDMGPGKQQHRWSLHLLWLGHLSWATQDKMPLRGIAY